MQQYSQGSQRSSNRRSPTADSDTTAYPPSHTSSMTLTEDQAGPRTSGGSGRSTHARRPQNPEQQLSMIEKSVTHLLVATKQLLETLTLWSRGNATEGEVSDVYVRLGYEFNIASRAFNAIGVDTADLGNVPELLRGILEETLSQEASQASLDRFLPRIRDIIINLLHGLKKKQQRLRQRSGRDGRPANGTGQRSGSVGSDAAPTGEDGPSRQSSTRPPPIRQGSGELDGPGLPPRTSSVAGRASPSKYDSLPSNPRSSRATNASRDTLASESSLSSNAAQNIPVMSPYPTEDTMPKSPQVVSPYVDFPPPPPPPPPPKQQDALAALQRGGELERRASRRFSAYQIQKHLGNTNGIPMMPPSQNSPIPNRGKEARESMNAVRIRGSLLHSRQQSTQKVNTEISPSRQNEGAQNRISEESSQSSANQTIQPPPEPSPEDSPVKTPEDKVGPQRDFEQREQPSLGATVTSPLGEPAEISEKRRVLQQPAAVPTRHGSRTIKSPSPTQFIPDQSPQPGKELTLFLQYKSKIKKFVLADGYNDLSIARLQLAFIEKFAWNTHNNGVDLPEIYIQDPVSGVRHELEDLSDIKDRSVLVLNVEALDEVKKHIDDGIGSLRSMIEGIKSTVDEQQASLQRVSERQQDAAKDIASIAATPSTRVSMLGSGPVTLTPGQPSLNEPSAQLTEVQSLRRDLAVVRQTYTSFVADIESSMSAVRAKAATVKSSAVKAAMPSLNGDSGRAYVNARKKALEEDSTKIVNRVDDLQDLVEDLRKDVVTRGVRPLPRQLETVAKDLSLATAELKKLQEFLKREKPLWTKIWEQELQTVCDERELMTMQEDLVADLEDDLQKAGDTFSLVEQATKQQNAQTNGVRSASGKGLHGVALDQAIDPVKAKDDVLGEVRALQPNHESRLEAIERAEKARKRELESRQNDEFQKELGNFVEEGKLKKSGGVEEVERLRKAKDERIRKEVFERQAARAKAAEERAAAAAAAAAAEAANAEAKADGDATGAEAAGAPQQGSGEVQEGAAAAERAKHATLALQADTPLSQRTVLRKPLCSAPEWPVTPICSGSDDRSRDDHQENRTPTIEVKKPSPRPVSRLSWFGVIVAPWSPSRAGMERSPERR